VKKMPVKIECSGEYYIIINAPGIYMEIAVEKEIWQALRELELQEE